MADKIVEVKTKSELLADFLAILAALSDNKENRDWCLQESIHYRYEKNQNPKLYKGTIEKVN
jgi:hypothetical protein